MLLIGQLKLTTFVVANPAYEIERAGQLKGRRVKWMAISVLDA